MVQELFQQVFPTGISNCPTLKINLDFDLDTRIQARSRTEVFEAVLCSARVGCRQEWRHLTGSMTCLSELGNWLGLTFPSLDDLKTCAWVAPTCFQESNWKILCGMQPNFQPFFPSCCPNLNWHRVGKIRWVILSMSKCPSLESNVGKALGKAWKR